jgi:hypothetical protein
LKSTDNGRRETGLGKRDKGHVRVLASNEPGGSIGVRGVAEGLDALAWTWTMILAAASPLEKPQGRRASPALRALGGLLYIHGIQMIKVTDDAFKSGNPGMGFFIDGATGVNGDFGFSKFIATDK